MDAFTPCRQPARVGTLLSVVAAKKADGDSARSDTVKTTVELPGELWRAAKIRAMDERADLRTVLIQGAGRLPARGGTEGPRGYVTPMTPLDATTPSPAAPPSPKPTLASRGRRLIRHGLLIVTVVIVVDAVAGEKGLIALLQARREYAALERSLDQARAENATLRDLARRLREDPAAIEEEARRELGLIKPGETLFIVKDVQNKK